MPDLLSAALLAAWRKETGVSAGWAWEFDLVLTPGASATTIRVADADVASWSIGHFDGLVMKDGNGEGHRGIPLFTTDLQVPETTVTLLETTAESSLGARFWSKLIRGPVSRYVPGSAARCYGVSRDLTTFADAFLETNMVIQEWERQGDYALTLSLRSDTTLLDRALPDLVLTEALYPFADPEVWGLFAPILYGIYDSRSTTRKGMLPAYCVDRLEFRYFATIGPITVTAVFVDGEPYTDYTVELVQRGGYDVTEIVFATDLEDAAVTYDAMGYRDAAGVIITNPASQIAHFLRNFVFGNPTGTTWHTGAWLTACPMLNIAASSGFLAAYDYFIKRNLTGAGYIGAASQRNAVEVLNEWASCWHVQTFLRNDGKLDLLLLDPARRRPTTDTAWAREADVAAFIPRDENGLVRKVMVQYHLDPVMGQFGKNIELSDRTVPGNKGVLPHQMTWGPVNEGDRVFTGSSPSAP